MLTDNRRLCCIKYRYVFCRESVPQRVRTGINTCFETTLRPHEIIAENNRVRGGGGEGWRERGACDGGCGGDSGSGGEGGGVVGGWGKPKIKK